MFGGEINKTVDRVLKISNLKSKQEPGAAGAGPHSWSSCGWRKVSERIDAPLNILEVHVLLFIIYIYSVCLTLYLCQVITYGNKLWPCMHMKGMVCIYRYTYEWILWYALCSIWKDSCGRAYKEINFTLLLEKSNTLEIIQFSCVEIYKKYKILKYERERKESGSGEKPMDYILYIHYIKQYKITLYL